MKTSLLLALLFLSGCFGFSRTDTNLAKKHGISSVVELSKLTAKEQTTVYITKIQTSPLTVICWVGIGLGFFAFLSGNGWGLKLMASCAVVICGALILASATAWIAVATKWIILLAIVAAAVALGLLAYAIFVKGRALKEIVAGVEELKTTALPVGSWENNFPSGPGPAARKALSKQSPSTKAVVASIKKTLVPPK